MSNRFSRAVLALTLVFGLWMSAIPAGAEPSQQTQNQRKEAKAPNQAGQQNGGRQLAVNEDPRLIGKRNLNKRLIAKLSGSLEKEVALDRQLGAEVDKEAEFVNDR